jgi:hypothetical protein
MSDPKRTADLLINGIAAFVVFSVLLSLNSYLLTLTLPWLFGISINFGQGLVIISTIKLLLAF